ncbi:ADP-forming succinate--CoA ligase subunit beta [Elioraea tepida]|jgi:succinyl-CoA synthetase beta subunit|uniref:Succinate--CoA ligase [ADP-forming] subunit beta n=1 Tax=Elioraea tepida TaxID=2843330 RepID=A0A975YIR7_9PROT|nr:ADP-forming succinate--CoA ligase subunit beta [Elioraea tepida]QXM23678.1 ADP-forming succinate--CoA ligase subunit beta [Elioraea tepida]
MNIHEYQAKELLAKYGVAVLKGGVAWSPEEAERIAASLASPVTVVKAQIHAGGRGKGRFLDDASGKGGVRIARSPAEARAAAEAMIGKVLVTAQTGPAGRKVQRVYVESGCDIARELYLGLLVDRSVGRVAIMASTEGGVEIEEVAARHPERILRVHVDPATGVQPFHGRTLAFGLGLSGSEVRAFTGFVLSLYRAFVELDCAIVEINPLVVTSSGDVVALDAKVSFDDNALFRHLEIAALRDESEMDPKEIEAAKYDLNYVALDGNIGCMVNGAGLAMATMDIIKLYGGEPANFLDVGGGATKERVTAAFKIILSDPKVEGILVNIFGGIMRCDVIAEGVVAAAREVSLSVPLVVRLEGTNVELGKKILAASGLPIVSADNLADAAAKVVQAVKEAA